MGRNEASVLGVAGLDGATQPATSCEFPDYGGRNRFAGLNKISQDAVHRIFIKDPKIAIGVDINFERFQLDTGFVWHVGQSNGSKIGQPGLWANGRIFRNFNGNFVAWILIRPGFKAR